jgi:diguanylate cyclase (GGDEF)-like protein/putative nucleotidyltransferase with HDIG domain/PAS domain S-box-containing protein
MNIKRKIFYAVIIYFCLISGINFSSNKIFTVVGDINDAPYSFLDKDGNPAGFSIELIKEALKEMNYDLEISLMSFSDAKNMVSSGEKDFLADIIYSKEREEEYTFSNKYHLASGDVFSKKENRISEIYDLKNKRVVIQSGNIVGEMLKALDGEMDLNIKFYEVDSIEEAFDRVSNDFAEYASVLKIPGYYYKEKNQYKIEGNQIENVVMNFCFATKKGDIEKIEILNSGLDKLKKNGKYKEIYDRYLGIHEKTTLIDGIKAHRGIILITIIIMIFLSLWIWLLRKFVKIRTKDLLKSNKAILVSNNELEDIVKDLEKKEKLLRNRYSKLVENRKILRESKNRYIAFIKAMPDIIFVLDKKGIFLDYQGNDDNLLLESEKIIGNSIEDIVGDKDSKEIVKKIEKAIDTKETQMHKYSLNVKKEEEFYEVRLVPNANNEVVAIVRDITLETKSRNNIEYLSYHDQLTGVFNRRFFEAEIERLDNKRNFPLCLIMGDVNGLKLINDSFGHNMGDKLLSKVGEILKEVCRESDIIARIGGDEFMILAKNMSEMQAEKLVKRIKSRCICEKIAELEISISFGWAAKNDIEESIEDTFNRAEDYLYKKKLFEGPSMRGKTIDAIINTLHEKNKREADHSERVSYYCKLFAIELGMNEVQINDMKTAGLLHDIGKIAIDEKLLNKSGKLDKDEFELIKKHSEVGYRILSTLNDMSDIAEIALSHHERWDGKGYPRGLKEQEIPYLARIVSIVDAYDAMTSERSYRKPLSEYDAKQEILNNAGTQFDPYLAERFVNRVLEIKKDA